TAILLLSQIQTETVQSAYQLVILAAIILYFIPFVYMFAAVIKLAGRPDRGGNPHAVLIPGGKVGGGVAGALGLVVVLLSIALSFVPPGEETNKIAFEVKLVGGTLVSILIGLVLYWRGARSKRVR